MSVTLRDYVLETLTAPFVQDLNFRLGATLVYPSGYKRDIANAVRHNHIRLTGNPADIGPSQTSDDSAFVMGTLPGQVHPLLVTPSSTELRAGVWYVRDSLSLRATAELKGTIIHEATHALQDFQRVHLDHRLAEASAYLAGAIATQRSGYRPLGPVPNPRVHIRAYSLFVADRILLAHAESDTSRRMYVIPEADQRILLDLALTGSREHYVFNGI